MRLRVAAFVTLALLGAYHLMRAAATACAGGGCDFYIPLSLLLPVMILIATAVTGALGMSTARRDTTWLIVLGICTVLSVAGPLVALSVMRDSPDAFVVTSTTLVALVPAASLVYTFTRLKTA